MIILEVEYNGCVFIWFLKCDLKFIMKGYVKECVYNYWWIEVIVFLLLVWYYYVREV